jgi:hypothetical protein
MPALKREHFLTEKEKTVSLLEGLPNAASISIDLQVKSLDWEHVDSETFNDSSQPIVIAGYIHSSNKKIATRLSKLRKFAFRSKIRSLHARLYGTRFLLPRVN